MGRRFCGSFRDSPDSIDRLETRHLGESITKGSVRHRGLLFEDRLHGPAVAESFGFMTVSRNFSRRSVPVGAIACSPRRKEWTAVLYTLAYNVYT